ncbi:vascular endothelial growth factor receptor 2 [Striga asiatica]|uniref:Vascular endothelial growth factor receptor 2 n=1 Tax=Striga asiatica TaxID=4170 RepID=A0A5A7R995_STRAF|nr:vascular endothelial growth factor receptor 2 [Striga asiatica]
MGRYHKYWFNRKFEGDGPRLQFSLLGEYLLAKENVEDGGPTKYDIMDCALSKAFAASWNCFKSDYVNISDKSMKDLWRLGSLLWVFCLLPVWIPIIKVCHNFRHDRRNADPDYKLPLAAFASPLMVWSMGYVSFSSVI